MDETKITYRTDRLWQKLEQFPFDEGFETRLARENGWGVFFTRQVLVEYRRFLYLTQRAGHAVTPSKRVDEAWHLHLLYTRSYWEGLCGETLGQPLHHAPGTGKPGDETHFAAQYSRTKESYRRLFGTEPPQSVWGEPIPGKRRERVLGWLATALGAVGLTGASAGATGWVVVGTVLLLGLIWRAAAVQPPHSRQGKRGANPSGSTEGGSACGGLFIASACTSDGSTDTGDSSGGDSGAGDGGSGCGSSCGGGGCGS